jgi:hypothetical protein
LQIVYLTPELATSDGGLARIRALHLQHGGVSVLAVDEAHCISEWGRDFRPDFQRLHRIRCPTQGLGPDVPVIAVSKLFKVQEGAWDSRSLRGLNPWSLPHCEKFRLQPRRRRASARRYASG